MPERFQPERQFAERLRPAVEIAAARNIAQKDAQHYDKERKKTKASNEWFNNLSGHLTKVFGTPANDAEKIATRIKTDILIDKSLGWRDALSYAQRQSAGSYFSSDMDYFVMEEINAGNVTTPRSIRSATDIEHAKDRVNDFIEDLSERPKKKQSEIQRMRHTMQTTEDYIDYVIAEYEANKHQEEPLLRSLGRGYLPGREEEEAAIRRRLIEEGKLDELTKRGNAYGNLFRKIQSFGSYAHALARKEALDYVLQEEDEHNGLAKLIAEQKETPNH